MFAHRHLLGIAALSAVDIRVILERANHYVELNRRRDLTTMIDPTSPSVPQAETKAVPIRL